ncbi:MAG: L28 family ribosomal protein [bacterium]
MSKVCDICRRGPQIKISRSHSMIATRKKQYLNLQAKTVDGKRLRICNRCLKTLKKNK